MTDYAAKLKSENVLIGNEKIFNEKIEKIRSGGIESVQGVFDFDATISKAFHRGEKAQSCHNCLENILSDDEKGFFEALNKKFMKIEFDPSLSRDEKIPHMEEWWSTAHGRMVAAKLDRDTIEKAVKDSALILRENEDSFFKLYEDLQVPILLFSAGISQIVQFAMVYKAKAAFTDNMKVISNDMLFDDNGILVGFSNPLIHTFSKTPRSIGPEWLKTLEKRNNVLLMGDSHGDPNMVEDNDLSGGVCLRIGYLNRQIEENIEVYKKMYDIVLVQDETLDIPIEITKLCFSK